MFKKYLKRIYQNAWDRWKDHQEERRVGTDKSNLVLNKMRNRFLKDGFDRLKVNDAY